MNTRKGIRIITLLGVHPEVKRACLEFGQWLRTEYEFPIRIRVYLKKDYRIKGRYNKKMVTATFFAPADKTKEPHIRIATGDYLEVLQNEGKDNALAGILGSIAHELGHYYQWIDDLEMDEEEEEKDADEWREEMISLYSETREHP